MSRRLLLVAAAAALPLAAWAQPQIDWPVHSEDRPQPEVVTPGATAADPPSDAIVLFGGDDLDAWTDGDEGGAAQWKVENGYFEVVPGTGYVKTREGFGDVQVHLEWQAADPPTGEGQNRSNSGLFFMDGRYEVQVLDNYNNQTYPDGQATALYGQTPPMVNASRPPGEWQTYDVVFRRPRFAADGSLLAPARVTVFHNGVLVQDATELTGPTAHQSRPPYKAHAERLPMQLQDHGDPVRFRNIWVRDLEAH